MEGAAGGRGYSTKQHINGLGFPLGANEMVDVAHHVRFFRSPRVVAKLFPVLLNQLRQCHGAIVAEVKQFGLRAKTQPSKRTPPMSEPLRTSIEHWWTNSQRCIPTSTANRPSAFSASQPPQNVSVRTQ